MCVWPVQYLNLFTWSTNVCVWPIESSIYWVIKRYPLKIEDKIKREKIKGLHREILKSGVFHKEFCVKSLWENLKYRDKRKTKGCINRGCTFENAWSSLINSVSVFSQSKGVLLFIVISHLRRSSSNSHRFVILCIC